MSIRNILGSASSAMDVFFDECNTRALTVSEDVTINGGLNISGGFKTDTLEEKTLNNGIDLKNKIQLKNYTLAQANSLPTKKLGDVIFIIDNNKINFWNGSAWTELDISGGNPFNQDLNTTNNVTFNDVTTTTGLINSVNVGDLKTDVDGFPDELKNLTASEITQLEQINLVTISNAQWAYLGELNQALKTSDNVVFNEVSGNIKTDSIDEQTADNGIRLQKKIAMKSYTTIERDALLNVVNGDIIYNTTNNEFEFYENGQWKLGAGNPFNQQLNTTDNVVFVEVGANIKTDLIGELSANNGIVMNNKITLKSYTTAQRDSLVGVVNGDMIYNSQTNRINIYESSTWKELTIYDQSLNTTDNVTFNDVDVSGDLAVDDIGEKSVGAGVRMLSKLGLAQLTTIQRDALTAVNGDMIYNITTNEFEAYENGQWKLGFGNPFNQQLNTSNEPTFVNATVGTMKLNNIDENTLNNGIRLDKKLTVKSYTTVQRDALVGVSNGDMIYNTTDNHFQFYENGAWTNNDTGNPFDQTLNTTDNVTFNQVTVPTITTTGDLTLNSTTNNKLITPSTIDNGAGENFVIMRNGLNRITMGGSSMTLHTSINVNGINTSGASDQTLSRNSVEKLRLGDTFNSSSQPLHIDNINELTASGGVNIGSNLNVTNAEINLTHTSTADDDHALEIDCNAAGFGDVKAIDVVYVSGGINTGDLEEGILINLDETGANGGDFSGYELVATEGNMDAIYGVKVGGGIGPIDQLSGVFSNPTVGEVNAVDDLADLVNPAVNVNIFTNDNDTVTVGNSSKFEEIEFILSTPANQSIQPTFEYSTGVGTWTTFSPTDGTNGMRNTGVLLWNDGDIPTWAPGAGGAYLIRITRTRNVLSTPPVCSKLQILVAAEYSWDKNGDITANSINVSSVNVDTIDEKTTDNGIRLDKKLRLKSYTTVQRDALVGVANGDIIYNTTDNQFQFYENGGWVNSGGNPFDQSLNTTDSPTFNNLTITGLVDGRNISDDGIALDALVTNVGGITAGEGSQLQNIDTVTISNAQWAHVGNMNQGVATTDNVTFNQITGTLQTAAQTNINQLGTLVDLQVDNISVSGNSISSTDTNGAIILAPDGTGIVSCANDMHVHDIAIDAPNIVTLNKANTDLDLRSTGTGLLRLNQTVFTDGTDVTIPDAGKLNFGVASGRRIEGFTGVNPGIYHNAPAGEKHYMYINGIEQCIFGDTVIDFKNNDVNTTGFVTATNMQMGSNQLNTVSGNLSLKVNPASEDIKCETRAFTLDSLSSGNASTLGMRGNTGSANWEIRAGAVANSLDFYNITNTTSHMRINSTGAVVMNSLNSSAVGTNLIISGGEILEDSSSRRYKENIQNSLIDSSFIYDLKMKDYTAKNDVDSKLCTGFIAEELAENKDARRYVNYKQIDGLNLPNSINYRYLVCPIIEEMKKMRTELDIYKSMNLENRLNYLEEQMKNIP